MSKILLINGSPNEKGCTYTALAEIAATLHEQGVETEMIWLGKKPVQDCIACHSCMKTGRCVFTDIVMRRPTSSPLPMASSSVPPSTTAARRDSSRASSTA